MILEFLNWVELWDFWLKIVHVLTWCDWCWKTRVKSITTGYNLVTSRIAWCNLHEVHQDTSYIHQVNEWYDQIFQIFINTYQRLSWIPERFLLPTIKRSRVIRIQLVLKTLSRYRFNNQFQVIHFQWNFIQLNFLFD